MKSFTVKDLADLFDNTRGGIRFYEEKGLLEPQRDKNGHRFYSPLDIFQLFYLKRYCSIGCSLDEVITYFRSDNKNELEDIQDFYALKEAEIKREIARYENQLAWLKHHQEVFMKCQHNINQLTLGTVGDYYYLDETYFADWSSDKARVLQKWIAAAPQTAIHIDLIPASDATYDKCIGIGIMCRQAKEIGLEIPPEAKFLKGSKVFRTIIQASGADFHLTCDDQIHKFILQVKERGYTTHLLPSLTLIFSHHIQQKKKYYELFIPIQ